MTRIRRLAAALAGLACAWLGIAVATPAAFALPVPPPGGGSGVTLRPEPPGWNKHPPLPVQVHTIAVRGMPGWQIALIAISAPLVAATVGVLADRARTARRQPAAPAA
jgi:hypothetical protein